MNKKFTKLIAALALLTFLAVPMGMRGQSDYSNVETSNVTLTPGTNGSACTVNGEDGIKVGTSSKGGDMTVTVPAGTTHLHIHAAAWKDVTGLSLNITPQANVSPTSIALISDSGISGNSPFTLAGDASDFYFVIALSNITASTDIKFETSIAKRFVIWGCNAEEVSSNDPTMSVNPSSIAFGNKVVGTSSQESFTVTYANLTANASVSLSGSNLTGCTISPTSFSVDESGSGSQAVTVTYAPQAAGTLDGTITVADATDELSETVTVTGTAKVAHNITIGYVTNGNVTADKSTAIEGETITLTVTPNSNYAVSSLTVVGNDSGDEVTITNNQFTMPNEAVTVSATFVATAVDVMNQTWTGITGTSYSAWSGKKGSASDAVYAGNCAGGNSSIQLRSSNNSGIVSTTSGGKVKKVVVAWNSSTASGRTLDIYGSNTAYTGSSQLYNSSTQGTKLGSIVCGTSTELAITGDYTYIGLRSNNSAMYLDEIVITWRPNSVKNPTFSPAGGTFTEAQTVTINCETTGAVIYYTIDGSTPSSSSTLYEGAINLSTTTTLRAIAIKDGESSAETSATYTFLTPLTTMDEILEAATSTETTVAVTFDNWVISGVSSTQAYITDGTKGCMLYNVAHGFTAGNILNGTVVCKLGLYYGKPQFKELTSATSGLDVTTGGTVTPVVTTIGALGIINNGSVVTFRDLTYNGSTLSDGTNTIEPYNGVGYTPSFTSGKTYDVTGVYGYGYGSTDEFKRIFPRDSEDIVLKAVLDIDASMTLFSCIAGNGPSAEENIDVICTDLGSNTLTATASSDYEVSLTLDGNYTQYVEMTPTDGEVAETVYVRLKAGLSVGEHNGTVTFTADNLTTQNVALEGLVSGSQTYSIILTQPDEATIAADKAIAEAGETVTLSYSDVDDCYEFYIWSVLYEIDEEIFDITPDANNQFTMPAADVYVYATFEQKTFTVQYSVNGAAVSALTESVNCGSNATLPTTGITVPTGYTFAGWSTAASSTAVVSSYTPTDDATLYAVLAQSGGSLNYVKVTEDLIDWSGEYLIVYENDGVAFDGSLTTLDGGNNVIEVTITDGKIASNSTIDGSNFTIASVSGGYSIKSASGYYIGSTSYNNELKTSTTQAYANTLSIDGFGDAVILGYSSGSNQTTLRFNSNSGDNNYRFRYYKSGQQDIQLYKKQVPSAYTRVEEITSAETLPSIEPTYLITVQDGGVLTLTGPNNGDASNLIIEDGGQLITSSTGVQATVKKDIEGAGDDNWGEPDPENPYTPTGWYFIASPVNGASFSTAATGDYDLYMLDWANNKWRNIKNAENASLFANGFQRGTGYLYASKGDNTLSVAGEIKPLTAADTAKVVLATTGWNLIGNPLTCKVTVDSAFVELNNASAVTSKGKNSVVNPYQGIAVYGTAGNMVTFTKATTQNATAPGNSALQMIVAQNIVTRGNTTSATVDNAVISFNEGSALPKFTMLESIANLYIPQGTKEYAIVSSEAQGTMPVNFRANENGTYTLTVNPENVEMNYLHLIDNLTGANIDLLQTPSYSFNATTTDYESRFKLVFATNNEDGASTGSAAFAFYSNGNWIINNAGEATLQVVDITGRILSSETVNGSVSTTINATPGVYMLRLINGENVKVQKIVVR